MSLSTYLSKHLPGVAAGVIPVTGSVTIATGLKTITGVTANIKAGGVTANEESDVTVQWGGAVPDGSILITVEKGGTNHGDAGDSAVDVSFMAHGDR